MNTELAETMEAAFADIVGTPPPETKGNGTVIWYLKAAQRCNKQAADIVAYHDAMRDEIKRWLDSKLDSLSKKMMWLDETYLPTVEAVTRDKIAHGGKKRSFDFFYGMCGFRKQQTQWDWPKDETELLKWCVNNGVPVNTTVTINKQKIKDHHDNTGEVPPGVTITPGKDVFYVKPKPLALPAEQPKLLGTDQPTTKGAHE